MYKNDYILALGRPTHQVTDSLACVGGGGEGGEGSLLVMPMWGPHNTHSACLADSMIDCLPVPTCRASLTGKTSESFKQKSVSI